MFVSVTRAQTPELKHQTYIYPVRTSMFMVSDPVLGKVIYISCARSLTLVLTTGLITIFILVISVIGKWSVICDC